MIYVPLVELATPGPRRFTTDWAFISLTLAYFRSPFLCQMVKRLPMRLGTFLGLMVDTAIVTAAFLAPVGASYPFPVEEIEVVYSKYL